MKSSNDVVNGDASASDGSANQHHGELGVGGVVGEALGEAQFRSNALIP